MDTFVCKYKFMNVCNKNWEASLPLGRRLVQIVYAVTSFIPKYKSTVSSAFGLLWLIHRALRDGPASPVCCKFSSPFKVGWVRAGTQTLRASFTCSTLIFYCCFHLPRTLSTVSPTPTQHIQQHQPEHRHYLTAKSHIWPVRETGSTF